MPRYPSCLRLERPCDFNGAASTAWGGGGRRSLPIAGRGEIAGPCARLERAVHRRVDPAPPLPANCCQPPAAPASGISSTYLARRAIDLVLEQPQPRSRRPRALAVRRRVTPWAGRLRRHHRRAEDASYQGRRRVSGMTRRTRPGVCAAWRYWARSALLSRLSSLAAERRPRSSSK